jgi:ABC-type Zn uptake system ZnuABC Zn-binding protein ZnuA
MESKKNRGPWVLAIALFLVGLTIGGALVGSSRGMNSPTSSTVTTTAPISNGPVLKVLATFFPLQDWAAAVGGNKAKVSLLVPVSIDVHEFEPSPAAIQAIAEANILVLNGAGLETWASAAIAAANNPHLIVVDCSVGISLIKLPPQFQLGNRTIDPHIWNDPVDAMAMVKNILAGFIQADPSDASYFTANANAYGNALQVLNQEFVDLTSSQLATRDFVTFHTAWGYLAQQYNLTQIPVFGPFEDQPTPADIQNVVNAINQDKLCYVGYESLENPAIPQTIAAQTHATLVPMDPNEGLSQQQQAVGETYLTMMQTMLFVMTLALTRVGC